MRFIIILAVLFMGCGDGGGPGQEECFMDIQHNGYSCNISAACAGVKWEVAVSCDEYNCAVKCTRDGNVTEWGTDQICTSLAKTPSPAGKINAACWRAPGGSPDAIPKDITVRQWPSK